VERRRRLAAERAALGFLARREHSAEELRGKLSRRFGAELVEAVLECLVQAGSLSDARFAHAFVDYRIRRGQGPNRIRAELERRGIEKELVLHCLERREEEWAAGCEAALRRRLGAGVSGLSAAERARQERFLAGRGFTRAQIGAAMRAVQEALDG